MEVIWPVTILFAAVAFSLGWWAGRRSVRSKLGEIKAKVDSGKEAVQKAINKYK